MIEDELIKIWQSSSNQERLKFEKSKLMIELQSSLNRLHRWWNFVELMEIVLAIVGVLLSITMFFIVPFILTKIALVLLTICAIYLIIKYQNLKRFKPNNLKDTYVDYLKKTKGYLEVQKRFLTTYLYWGILPAFPLSLLFTISIWEKVPTQFIVLFNVAVIIIGVYGYFLNKRRVKKEIDPRITSVDEMINRLK